MKPLVFFDTEIDPRLQKILDIGAIKDGNSVLHTNKLYEFNDFIEGCEYLCGHNALKHDWEYIKDYLPIQVSKRIKLIDTLFYSPLLFPSKPYHRLVKDDKLIDSDINNPVNDSKKARDLFYDEIAAFTALDDDFKSILYYLLADKIEFKYFFEYISYKTDTPVTLEELIRKFFKTKICENAPLDKMIYHFPVELAYSLALVNSSDKYSLTPPWVIKTYPEIERIMYLLRSKVCITGCDYCDEALDANKALKRYFGFESYRKFDGKSLQEDVVNAAIGNKSLLAIFPTGGGKSITFQVPALMEGDSSRGLTVVISPLQSLMKDQVDNLEKSGITQSVTINGLLDPIERSKSFERVENGTANILYISPESLRSKTIERLLLSRRIARFVVDEAHCLSSWGQDFRVDYLYIADFIKSLQEKKNLSFPIPVSCFTATAKQMVIRDICDYFEEKLDLKLEVYKADIFRTNLKYRVFNSNEEEDKYNKARNLLESHKCPTIIYVSRTRKAFLLAERLTKDGFNAKPYHGKMDISSKKENQEAFIAGDVDIMVATSAFGMGVDKKDVGLVIHYDISDSLENYVQEAGRAGRDEKITADCYVLYNEEDLNKHFVLLNQTKITIKEIQQIWVAIKKITNFKKSVSNSALEIARKAGWDDNISEIESRVKTAISALEQAGYLKRGQNNPRIFASGILTKNAQEAIDKINTITGISKEQKVNAVRIIKKLFSAKSRKNQTDEEAESRVDYISDHLGIVREEVIQIITLLREEKILADTKDLTAFVQHDQKKNKSLARAKSFSQIEDFLRAYINEEEKTINLKEINEAALAKEIKNIDVRKIKTILNFWEIKNLIKKQNHQGSSNHIAVISKIGKRQFKEKQARRHQLAVFIVDYLYSKIKENDRNKSEILIEFSVLELKQHSQNRLLFAKDIDVEDIEDTLFYLSKIGAITIEGGFLVVYNKLTINRLENNNKVQYKKDDYKQLETFYNSKMQQIHIVGEYAKNMLDDYSKALRFVDDYFKLNYNSFLNLYFPGSRKDEIQKNITPKKFRQLFGTLSPRQLDIINDKISKYIVVAAGPGSGKTRVLVHKLASLLLMEDIKHEQLLMLTFSRAAATEFKKRLLKLIGNAANYVEIKTFHSYCFDLLGKVGSIEKSADIIKETVEKIEAAEVEQSKITKLVLVIDEAQDMTQEEFDLVYALMKKNTEMRVIAVGDDDQNIYTFRGSDSKYFEMFLNSEKSKKYELIENYRSKKNLIEFTNQFVEKIKNRLKKSSISPVSNENGIIDLYQYKSNMLYSALTKNIYSTGIAGSTAVLTQTNDEALQITGLLNNNGIPAKLIQSNTDFNLYNLIEIRTFIDDISIDDSSPIISKDIWNNAKKQFAARHKTSDNYELAKQLIKDFQTINPKIKYKTDFETFVRESGIEDFTEVKGETVFVSTIHKAKGKEFDNVFIMLNGVNAETDDEKRKLYVAMTRAKHSLIIHHRGINFDNIFVDDLAKYYDGKNYPKPHQLLINLSHRDVHLSHFYYVQKEINSLKAGDKLTKSEFGLSDKNGNTIVKFSNSFKETIQKIQSNGYSLNSSKINYILYWSAEKKEEVKIILPQVVFFLDMLK